MGKRIIQKPKILVIDDDKNLCENLEQILTYEDYAVKYALDGPSGLRRIRAENFQLVILDLKMPGMDGVEVFGRIKKLNPKIGVIILTAYPSLDTAITTLKNDANDYIVKPFKNEDLVKAVKATAKKIGLLENPFSRLNKQVGQNVRALRMQKNIPLKELAERAGLSVGLISGVENGKNAASVLTLYRIAQILDIKLSLLVEGI
ncbi:MAG: response regulator [Candidatus Omnitrophica bacterium]|nr:response regulator [Candidatus Omnitrophota bacterium]